MRQVEIKDLASELANAYATYTEDVVSGIEEAADLISKDAVAEIKQKAPKRTGGYAKGFRRVKRKTPASFEFEIWNPQHYRRVHLLEKGWTGRDGKRIAGRAHMGPAEVNAVKRFEIETERIIKEGGK